MKTPRPCSPPVGAGSASCPREAARPHAACLLPRRVMPRARVQGSPTCQHAPCDGSPAERHSSRVRPASWSASGQPGDIWPAVDAVLQTPAEPAFRSSGHTSRRGAARPRSDPVSDSGGSDTTSRRGHGFLWAAGDAEAAHLTAPPAARSGPGSARPPQHWLLRSSEKPSSRCKVACVVSKRRSKAAIPLTTTLQRFCGGNMILRLRPGPAVHARPLTTPLLLQRPLWIFQARGADQSSPASEHRMDLSHVRNGKCFSSASWLQLQQSFFREALPGPAPGFHGHR